MGGSKMTDKKKDRQTGTPAPQAPPAPAPTADLVPEVPARKKTSWAYSLTDHILIANFPDGVKAHFDLTKVTVGMTATQELGFQYGIKQWFASNTADPKVYDSSKAKIAGMKEDYDGLIAHGLSLSGEGQIGVTGKTRSNATAGVKVELAKVNSMLDLMIKEKEEGLTEDEGKILAGMIMTKKALDAKNVKA
jgi:hypothetical protein